MENIEIEDPTEENIIFWQDVFETHRIIMGKSGKPKTRKQIISWLKNQQGDSLQYKSLGNSVAIPVVEYIMQGFKGEEL